MTDEETTTRAEVSSFLYKKIISLVYGLFTDIDHATYFQSFFKQFEKNPDGSVSQEQFMKALKNEKNLIDLLTQ